MRAEMRARARVCVCGCVCVRARVCVRVRVRVRALASNEFVFKSQMTSDVTQHKKLILWPHPHELINDAEEQCSPRPRAFG